VARSSSIFSPAEQRSSLFQVNVHISPTSRSRSQRKRHAVPAERFNIEYITPLLIQGLYTTENAVPLSLQHTAFVFLGEMTKNQYMESYLIIFRGILNMYHVLFHSCSFSTGENRGIEIANIMEEKVKRRILHNF